MIKNRLSHNRVQLKKKNLVKPANWSNQGYLVKFANRVIDSTKFNNLVFFKIIFI